MDIIAQPKNQTTQTAPNVFGAPDVLHATKQAPEIKELIRALVSVQEASSAVKAIRENPFYQSKYASLSDCWAAVRSLLAQNGLAVIQFTEAGENGIMLITRLAHVSGQWIEGKLFLRPIKTDPQSMGSALTYARRYALCAILGITVEEEDDDGNSASFPSGAENSIKPKTSDNPGDLICTFGKKFIGKRIKDIPEMELEDYIAFLERSAQEKQRPLGGAVLTFVQAAKFYLSAIETKEEA